MEAGGCPEAAAGEDGPGGPHGPQAGESLAASISPPLHGFRILWLRVSGPEEIWVAEETGPPKMCEGTPAGERCSGDAPCGASRRSPSPPALAGSAFTSSPFPRFVPGCRRSELGFNFPAPAASRGSPEGGAESERWERKKRGC